MAVVLWDVEMAEETYHVPAPLESFASWPAWQRAEHLTHCCHFCRDPYTVHHLNLGACAGCGQLGCSDCVRGCDDCYEIWGPPDCECDRDALEDPDVCNCQRSAPRYCFDCHHGRLHEVPCGRVVCARHLTWHDDTAEACAHTLKSCFNCILHQRKVRDTLVREVERNLLLGAQDRAAPARDRPLPRRKKLRIDVADPRAHMENTEHTSANLAVLLTERDDPSAV